jgi:D-glycero-D-manno-heptose 1,7-bisphosphate phosphatase
MLKTIDELAPKTRRVTLTPVLVLDLDDTVRRSKNGNKFIEGAADVELFPDVAPVLWRYRENGWLILGATNQDGVAFGFKTWDAEQEEITATLAAFSPEPPYQATNPNGLQHPFHCVKSCYHHEGGKVVPFCFRSLFRKPNIGMLAEFEKEAYDEGFICDWDNSLFVGDRPEDEGCAKNAGIPFAWAWDFFGRDKPGA